MRPQPTFDTDASTLQIALITQQCDERVMNIGARSASINRLGKDRNRLCPSAGRVERERPTQNESWLIRRRLGCKREL